MLTEMILNSLGAAPFSRKAHSGLVDVVPWVLYLEESGL